MIVCIDICMYACIQVLTLHSTKFSLTMPQEKKQVRSSSLMYGSIKGAFFFRYSRKIALFSTLASLDNSAFLYCEVIYKYVNYVCMYIYVCLYMYEMIITLGLSSSRIQIVICHFWSAPRPTIAA